VAVSGEYSDYLGRWLAMIAAALLFFFSAVPTTTGPCFTLLILARL